MKKAVFAVTACLLALSVTGCKSSYEKMCDKTAECENEICKSGDFSYFDNDEIKDKDTCLEKVDYALDSCLVQAKKFEEEDSPLDEECLNSYQEYIGCIADNAKCTTNGKPLYTVKESACYDEAKEVTENCPKTLTSTLGL